jgi:hypothetical protein
MGGLAEAVNLLRHFTHACTYKSPPSDLTGDAGGGAVRAKATHSTIR